MRLSLWALCASLVSSCAADFPAPPQVADIDAGDVGPNQAEGSFDLDASSSRPDVFVDAPPPEPDLGLGGLLDMRATDTRAAPMETGGATRACTHEWPAVCQVDCDQEPDSGELLWVRGDENHVLRAGQHTFVCVVIEGRLSIIEYASIEAKVIAVTRAGRIDGVGGGADRRRMQDGSAGRSLHGRGGGGGGGSGVCSGGGGAGLTDGTRAVEAGTIDRDLSASGGRGGVGGDRQGRGGQGGPGGASLRVAADQCVLAGLIDLSGIAGQKPLDSDGGGGGGGASGNLDLSCRHASFRREQLVIRLNGGFGGSGGTVRGRGEVWSGGGGGGGAAGALEVSAMTVTVDSAVSPVAGINAELRDHVFQLPGLGGEPGMDGHETERGEDGALCPFVTRTLAE